MLALMLISCAPAGETRRGFHAWIWENQAYLSIGEKIVRAQVLTCLARIAMPLKAGIAHEKSRTTKPLPKVEGSIQVRLFKRIHDFHRVSKVRNASFKTNRY
jgi:hypothetical protein